MMYALLLLALATCCGARHKFHHKMTRSELVHYFGTPHLHNVPEYDVISPLQRTNTRSSGDTLEYHVTALGEEYDLILQRNSDLMPASCLIHRHTNGTKVVEPCSLDGDDCYYFGTSASHNPSRVAVSTCLGLNGVIITGDHELYIQPVKTEHVSRVRRGVENPHIAYRKNVTRSSKGTTSDEVFYQLQSDSRAHRRRRSVKRTIELMVVTDAAMVKFHGDDTKRYVMTAINIAAQRLLDESLHEEIHVAVVKLTMLAVDQTELDVTRDAQYTLNKFCQWQEKTNPDGDTHPQHADASALITRLDIENLGNDAATGLAFVHGMCRQGQRCSYNQDTGLDLGLTVAHELGHTMGMTHDGVGNSCENGKYIMSSDGGTGSKGMEWSDCSVKALKDFLLTEQAECLTDEPVIREVKAVHQKPGLIYDADAQCVQSYGEGSAICESSSLTIGADECARLVCYDPLLPAKCTASTAPRMDGTDCGKGKWCIKGKCVSYGEDGPKPVDGGWSAWDSKWSSCSRTCGGGVNVKRRQCNNPKAAFGGKHCVGKDTQARLCNIHKCKKSQESFKADQCAATNSIALWGMNYSWVPYDKDTGDKACVMTCRDKYVVQQRAKQYRDGTFCTGEGSALFYRCVDAKCRAFGCDGVLDSGMVFDKCGKCNGQSNTCRKISGTFKKGEKLKYVTFITIPDGATGILITNKNSRTTLSIKVGKKRLFNPDGKKKADGRYEEGDISVLYTSTGTETVTTDGPLSNSIEAQVWREHNDDEYLNVAPDIYYEYHMPLSDDDPTEYSWATNAIRCSKSCSGGRQQLAISCIRLGDKIKVDNSYCDIRQQPNEFGSSCNEQPCPPSWQAGSFGKCSKSCGGGMMSRTVRCVRLQTDGEKAVDDSECSGIEKPPEQFTCNRKSCPGVWLVGPWSACSLTCGRGQQARAVECHRDETSEDKLDDSECISMKKPAASKECMLGTCKSSRRGTECKNKKDCSVYDPSQCSGKYKAYMEENCSLYCGFCSVTTGNTETTGTAAKQSSENTNSSCQDLDDCSAYGDVCTEYAEWSAKNCRKHCGLCSQSNKVSTKSPASTCVDAESDCATAYGDNVCTKYAEWSATHCKKHCGLCSQSNKESTKSPASTCVDAESDCATAYGDNVCTKYSEWSKIHCKKHCKFCSEDANGEVCEDQVDCSVYGEDLCKNSTYTAWSKKNCRKTCNFCPETAGTVAKQSSENGDSSCKDLDDCSAYGDNVCTEYAEWSATHCRKHCGLCSQSNKVTTISPASTCVDAESDCATAYGDNVCTEYAEWSKIHCKKHCKFCSEAPCSDLAECDQYKKDVCTAYGDWAGINCKKYCGLCGATRSKRSAVAPPILRGLLKPLSGRQPGALKSPKLLAPNIAQPARQKQIVRRTHWLLKPMIVPNKETKTSTDQPEKPSTPNGFPDVHISPSLPEVDTCGSLLTASALRINTLGKTLEDQECVFAISRPLSEAIVLHFDKIHVDCRKGDDLSLEDGASRTAIHLCHKTSNYTYTTKRNTALLKLTVGQKGSGYTLTYWSKKSDQAFTACSKQLSGQSGEIIPIERSLPNFFGKKCEVFINVKPKRRIKLHFPHFNLGNSVNCTDSFLKITDIVSNQADMFCGYKPGLMWESTGSRVKISYTLAATMRGKGFTGSYIAI